MGDRVVTAVKVKSHQTVEEASTAGVEHRHWLANHLADELADGAALEAQLPAQDITAVQQADKRLLEVQEHLLAVTFAVAQRSAAPLRPKHSARARTGGSSQGSSSARGAGGGSGHDAAPVVRRKRPLP